MFQASHLLPRLTAAQNAGLPLRYRGMSEGEIRTRALAAVAPAVIGEPSIIGADEPTGALDPDTAGKVMAAFERLCDERRTAMVVVTHSPEVEARWRRRTRLESGRLRETPR